MSPCHAAVAVEVDLHLGHLELEGPAGHPPGAENPGQVAHPPQQGPHLRRHLHGRRVGVGEEHVHLLVGEPPAALDRGRLHRGVHRDAVGRELDPAGAGVADLARLQARQVVGHDLRDHRDHAIGQVDARAAVPRLLVVRRAVADEVRDVGDVHAQQPVAPLDPLQRDRVVEVAGIDGIDRHDHAVSEIAAGGRDRLVEPIGLGPRVVERLFGERSGQAELVDHRLRVHAHVARLPEHLHHHALAVAEVRGKPHHLHHDLVVRVHALGAGIAHRDRPRHRRAIDLHPAQAGRLEVGADELRGPPLDHLDDLAGEPRATRVARPREPHADGVTGDGVERGDHGNVHIGRAVAGGGVERPDEAVAGGRPPKHAHHAVVAVAAPRGAWTRPVVVITRARHGRDPSGHWGGRRRNAGESVAAAVVSEPAAPPPDRTPRGRSGRRCGDARGSAIMSASSQET